MTATVQNVYAAAASNGIPLLQDHEPPRASNQFATPPTQQQAAAAMANSANHPAQANANVDAQLDGNAPTGLDNTDGDDAAGNSQVEPDERPNEEIIDGQPQGSEPRRLSQERYRSEAQPSQKPHVDLPAADTGLPLDTTTTEEHPWSWILNKHSEGDQELVPPTDEDLTVGPHIWKCSGQIGKGAFGSIQLWVKVDTKTSNIVDRMAVKQAFEGPKSRRQDRWYDFDAHIPGEIAAMRWLNQGYDGQLSDVILKYLGSRVAYPIYRICIPVAPFGDCRQFMSKWMDHFPKKRMPEGFFIDMLAALVEAGTFMKNKNLVHNDLKDTNILLDVILDDEEENLDADTPTEQQWRIRPVIIDFGLARPIKSMAFNNPTDFLGFGTPGFRAPEQSKQPVDPDLEPEDIEHVAWNAGQEINEKAMVFSFAAVIFRVSAATSSDHSDHISTMFVL